MTYNLQGKTITATGVYDLDNWVMVQYKDNQLSGGYCVKILWDLQHLLNFTLQTKLTDNYIKEENGTLLGIGRDLLDGSADISVPLSYFLAFRLKYISALHTLVREPIRAIFKQPGTGSIRDMYINTLSYYLRMALVLFLIVLGASLALVLRFEDSSESSDFLLIVVGAISEQGWHKRPEQTSTKILTFFTFLFGLIIIESFRATIISELAFERPAITEFDELLKAEFTILTDPIQQWGQYIEASHLEYISDEDSVRKSLSSGGGLFAFLTTWDGFIPIARELKYDDHYLCSVVSSVTFRNTLTTSGFYVAKNSSFKDHFNYGLTRIVECGLNKRHYRNLLQESTLGCLASNFEKQINQARELGFVDTRSGFALVFGGIILSGVFAVFEVFYRNFW